MPHSVLAVGATDESYLSGKLQYSTSEDWIVDPQQLINWQGQLVDCCHAISQQLNQIQDQLLSNADDDRCVQLRIVGTINNE